jgi:5-deoxy-glucuronate isomerase
MQLHFPAPKLQPGYNPICDPTNSPLRWTRFGRLWLGEQNGAWAHETGDHEETLVLLRGGGTLQISDGPSYTIGQRLDPFSGPPTMLHLPAGCAYRVVAGPDGLDAAIAAAPATQGGEPILIAPHNASETRHGAGPWGRKIYMGTAGDYPIQRLMVGETFNRPGGWTSYPPHKHDTYAPPEVPYEEIYFFTIKQQAGFGIQRIYDPPASPDALDATLVLHDGDTVVIPRGYHPVVGAPGYQMHYVWILCGEAGHRTYGQVTTDPSHAWLQQVEPLLED